MEECPTQRFQPLPAQARPQWFEESSNGSRRSVWRAPLDVGPFGRGPTSRPGRRDRRNAAGSGGAIIVHPPRCCSQGVQFWKTGLGRMRSFGLCLHAERTLREHRDGEPD